jgi:hypothetical protein
MQISVVRVAFYSEDEVSDALTRKRQKRKFYQRSIQQANASLAGFSREWKQPRSFSANGYYHSQPF